MYICMYGFFRAFNDVYCIWICYMYGEGVGWDDGDGMDGMDRDRIDGWVGGWRSKEESGEVGR